MGSSRKYTPAPPPVQTGLGGNDPAPQQNFSPSNNIYSSFENLGGFFNNVNKGSTNPIQPSSTTQGLSNGVNYSPFFMRF